MPKIRDLVKIIEDFAPLSIQADFDNSGLLYGEPERECHNVLITLDLNEAVVQEAKDKDCGLIIEHHPTIFLPLKKFDPSDPKHRALAKAISLGLAIYSAHTNVDFAQGGLNDRVAGLLGAEQILRIAEAPSSPRLGTLAAPISLKNFKERIAALFGGACVESIGDPDMLISRFAVINGGGGGDIDEFKAAYEAGAEVFVTGDLKYHIARFAKDAGYAIITFSHYSSELPFYGLMRDVFAAAGLKEIVRFSENCDDPYNIKE